MRSSSTIHDPMDDLNMLYAFRRVLYPLIVVLSLVQDVSMLQCTALQCFRHYSVHPRSSHTNGALNNAHAHNYGHWMHP